MRVFFRNYAELATQLLDARDCPPQEEQKRNPALCQLQSKHPRKFTAPRAILAGMANVPRASVFLRDKLFSQSRHRSLRSGGHQLLQRQSQAGAVLFAILRRHRRSARTPAIAAFQSAVHETGSHADRGRFFLSHHERGRREQRQPRRPACWCSICSSSITTSAEERNGWFPRLCSPAKSFAWTATLPKSSPKLTTRRFQLERRQPALERRPARATRSRI